jgi:ABC-type transport system involved in multi-copper enzyme maturation permease subunit
MGAAHGAWMGLLIGVLLTVVAWLAATVIFTYDPAFIVTLTNSTKDEIWHLTLVLMADYKLFLWIWLVVASSLSFWWRAL